MTKLEILQADYNTLSRTVVLSKKTLRRFLQGNKTRQKHYLSLHKSALFTLSGKDTHCIRCTRCIRIRLRVLSAG